MRAIVSDGTKGYERVQVDPTSSGKLEYEQLKMQNHCTNVITSNQLTVTGYGGQRLYLNESQTLTIDLRVFHKEFVELAEIPVRKVREGALCCRDTASGESGSAEF